MPGGLGPAPLDHEELERIELALALSAEEAYEKLLSLGDPFYQSMALQLWAGQTVSYDSPIRKQESLTPLQRYEEYSPAEREWLDLLPPEDIKSRLWSQPRRPFPR